MISPVKAVGTPNQQSRSKNTQRQKTCRCRGKHRGKQRRADFKRGGFCARMTPGVDENWNFVFSSSFFFFFPSFLEAHVSLWEPRVYVRRT